jgi:hypothetical protein
MIHRRKLKVGVKVPTDNKGNKWKHTFKLLVGIYGYMIELKQPLIDFLLGILICSYVMLHDMLT